MMIVEPRYVPGQHVIVGEDIKIEALRCTNRGLPFSAAINGAIERFLPGQKYDKYAPCPCGSGKKFKWCCFTPGKGS